MKDALQVLLIALLGIIIFGLLFWTCWPNTRLSSKIENLKFAPENLLCERTSPTAISLNYYANEKAGWRAIFAGRNHRDFHLGFFGIGRFGEIISVTAFAFAGNKWKYLEELTSAEKIEFLKKNSYTDEEREFINYCMARIIDYIEKSRERKNMYTPVVFFA